MLVARNEQNEIKVSWKTGKEEGPFFCPECGGEVVIKKGRLVAHHFAHKTNEECQHGSGESLTHILCKQNIFNFFDGFDLLVRMEHKVESGFIPDIYVVWDGREYALEIQLSQKSADELAEKHEAYRKASICPVWLAGELPGGKGASVTIMRTQRDMMQLSTGRLLVWPEDAHLISIVDLDKDRGEDARWADFMVNNIREVNPFSVLYQWYESNFGRRRYMEEV